MNTPKPQSQALVLPDPEKIKKLDALAELYSQGLSLSTSPFSATIQTAVAMGELRELLTQDVMAPIMRLMNTPLGFLTDRTGKASWKGETKPLYSWEEVRDCVIEGTLRGFATVGNEMNIIAGRFYAAKNGLRRKVTKFPGITDFRDSYEVPRVIGDKGAIVKCRATWRLAGVESSLEREFAVKGDSYATSDSYSGKAERKLLNAVFQRLSGILLPEGEVSEEPFVNEKPANAKTVAKPNFSSEPVPENHVVKGDSSGDSKAAESQETPGDNVAVTDAQRPDGVTPGDDYDDDAWLTGKGAK